MKALYFESFGDIAATLHIRELPQPVPGPDEVLVQVRASSINPSDPKNVQGIYKKTVLPRIPGQDFAGVVVAGDSTMIGQEVWGTGGDIGFTRDGSHAEYVVLPRQGVCTKPRNLSMIEASTIGRIFVTAVSGLIEKARMKEGETVLVTGATGGVGSSVVKLARARGAGRIIGIDRKALAPEAAKHLGIDLALGSETDDLAERIRDFTQDRGVDVAFDCVGGALFEISIQSLRFGGRQVNITATGERRVSFDLGNFFAKRLSLFGISTLSVDAAASGKILEDLTPDFEQGRLSPPEIVRTCPIDEAVGAYQDVLRGTAGKIVITF